MFLFAENILLVNHVFHLDARTHDLPPLKLLRAYSRVPLLVAPLSSIHPNQQIYSMHTCTYSEFVYLKGCKCHEFFVDVQSKYHSMAMTLFTLKGEDGRNSSVIVVRLPPALFGLINHDSLHDPMTPNRALRCCIAGCLVVVRPS